MTPDICIYHGPGCMDGLVAAWAIWKRFPDIEFVAAQYGNAPPDVVGKHVLITDFSYKLPMIMEMAKSAKSITILDHHRTAQADLAPFAVDDITALLILEVLEKQRMPVQALFDMDKSGARLAWEWAFPGVSAPMLVQHVEDRDLWRFNLAGTREVHAFLASLPETFEKVDELNDIFLRQPSQIFTAGMALLRQHDKDIDRMIEIGRQMRTICGYDVPVVNAPPWMASDLGNKLAVGHPFAASFYQTSSGMWSFSLRSATDGLDVSEIATKFGGGGHQHAAGFTVDHLLWEPV